MDKRPDPALRAGADQDGESGIRPRTVLFPVFAWLIASVLAFLYFNQRGRWEVRLGGDAYRDCYGGPPPSGLRLLACESRRQYRLTGELLRMECYARAESDSAGPWKAGAGIRPLDGTEGLPALLRAHGLVRVPEWFRLPAGADTAGIGVREGERWFALGAEGKAWILMAGYRFVKGE